MALNFAVGWVQYKLSGGKRNLLFTTTAYTAAAVALMTFGTQMAYRPSLAELAHYVPLFTFVQLIVLLLWGTVRVGQAVRNDVNSTMLESHRLMPVSPVSAILGYLFGSTVQVFTVFAINVLLGAICVAEANVPVRLWLMGNAVMVLYAIVVWSIVAFFSFRFAAAPFVMLAVQLVVVISQNARTMLLPGVGLIASPVFAEAMFRLQRLDSIEVPLLIACVLQVLIAAVYIAAAGNRYLRDKGPAFDWALAVLLLVLWIVACAAGIAIPQFEMRRFQSLYYQRDVVTVFATSMTAVCLLGILPIAIVIRERRVRPMLMVAVVTILAGAMLVVAPGSIDRVAVRNGYTIIELFAFFSSMRYMIGLAVARTLPAWLLVGVWLFVLWIFPTMIDSVITMNVPYSLHRTVSTWSPIVSLPAALYACWDEMTPLTTSEGWGAPLMQMLFAGVAAMIFHAFRRVPVSRKPVAATANLAEAAADLIPN